MSKVPGSARVRKVLRMARKEVKLALRQANQYAAKLLAKGNYDASKAAVDVAQAVQVFEAELTALSKRWPGRRAAGAVRSGNSTERTPLWEYYRPILQALAAMESAPTTAGLMGAVEPLLSAALRSGDVERMRNGRPRWQIMVQRARRPMVKEGYVQANTGQQWRLTAGGRRAAAAAIEGRQVS